MLLDRAISLLQKGVSRHRISLQPLSKTPFLGREIAAMSTSEDWKNQPPYGGFDVEKTSQAEWSGGCHCGSVKYEIYKKKPLDAKFCHCTTCQKMHGEPPLSPS